MGEDGLRGEKGDKVRRLAWELLYVKALKTIKPVGGGCYEDESLARTHTHTQS